MTDRPTFATLRKNPDDRRHDLRLIAINAGKQGTIEKTAKAVRKALTNEGDRAIAFGSLATEASRNGEIDMGYTLACYVPKGPERSAAFGSVAYALLEFQDANKLFTFLEKAKGLPKEDQTVFFRHIALQLAYDDNTVGRSRQVARLIPDGDEFERVGVYLNQRTAELTSKTE